MKKYAVGLLILLFIAGLTALSQWYTRSTVKEMQTQLDTMIRLIEAEQFDESLAQLKETTDAFSAKKRLMAAYSSHLRLDEVGASLGRLKAYLKKESANDGMAEIYALQNRLEVILHEERITLENIL